MSFTHGNRASKRGRSEAAARRRAARTLLAAAREKRLLLLASAELDELFESSRRFTGYETDEHAKLDGLWNTLLAETTPQACTLPAHHTPHTPCRSPHHLAITT